jgi:hypothetical protein
MKKNLSYVIFLFCVILLTSCSNKKEFTCVDVDTNDTGKKVQKEISKMADGRHYGGCASDTECVFSHDG